MEQLPHRAGFGLDEFTLDDRLRLFSYVTAENRLSYVWILRAFEAARTSYHVLLHTTDVASAVAALAVENAECPDPADLALPRLLDALGGWASFGAAGGTQATRIRMLASRKGVRKQRLMLHCPFTGCVSSFSIWSLTRNTRRSQNMP